jgi:SAM-dependent methyltransferase
MGLPMGSPSQLRRCDACGMTYFSVRYTDEQMEHLYSGYRGPTYVAQRRRWEPWYAAKVNDAYSSESQAVADRLGFMTRTLETAGLPSHLHLAVDFGGDEGQFFPDIDIDRRVVCDLSNRPLPPDIEHVSSLDQLGPDTADLVIVAHVLEHMSDPVGPLDEIHRAMADDGLLYIEVPLDGFATGPGQSSPRYEAYVRWLAHRRVAFIAVDFVSGLSRQFFSRIPTFGVVKQSEHINYFDSASLLGMAGFTVVAERADPGGKAGGLRLGRHGVAAVKTQPRLPAP